MSDEKQEEPTTMETMKNLAKRIAQTLESGCVVSNRPESEIINPINEWIKDFADVLKVTNVWFEPNDPLFAKHERLSTAWQEFQDSWARTYPNGIKTWVPHQTWKDCSEKAEQLSVLMGGFAQDVERSQSKS
jgi:hypothetical protein